jgi:MFS family permease
MIATFCCPWAREEYTLTAYAVIFGATSGAYVGLSSVILVDLMMEGSSSGIDNTLVNAFGILLLFQGTATTVGPPLGGTLLNHNECLFTKSFMLTSFDLSIGWVTDIATNSDTTFHLAGAMIAVSSALLLFTPYLTSQRKRSEVKEQLVSNTEGLGKHKERE